MLILVLPLQFCALESYSNNADLFADKEMATWIVRLFGHEVPFAALRPYFPYLVTGQLAAGVVAIKLQWRIGVLLVVVSPLLWICLVEARFYGATG